MRAINLLTVVLLSLSACNFQIEERSAGDGTNHGASRTHSIQYGINGPEPSKSSAGPMPSIFCLLTFISA